MAKTKKQSVSWDAALLAADEMSLEDESTSALAEQESHQRAFVLFSLIQKRETDTRPLNPEHVQNLAESIATLGLVEPLVIDQNHRLLAGGHRLAAIELLQKNKRTKYQQQFVDELIPVRIMPFDAEADPTLALQIEVAENEHRRDYTPAEVRKLADRLKASGYISTRGKPKAGDKPLVPALQIIVGKSRRTLMRYLARNNTKLNVPDDTFTKRQKILKKLKRGLQDLDKSFSEPPMRDIDSELIQKLPEFLATVDLALAEFEVDGT